MTIAELFDRFQYIAPARSRDRPYFKLVLEIMNEMNVQFHASHPRDENVLQNVPIFLARMGADIKRYETELFKEFLDTVDRKMDYCKGKYEGKTVRLSIRRLMTQAVEEFINSLN